MTKSHLSRFQAAEKAKLPNPAFLELLLSTWYFFVRPGKKENSRAFPGGQLSGHGLWCLLRAGLHSV